MSKFNLGCFSMLLIFLILIGGLILMSCQKNQPAETHPETLVETIAETLAETFAESEPVLETQPAATKAPETKAPETKPPETEAPETKAPETKVPETKAPETKVPETKVPETKAPETKAPETKAPETKALETKAPETKAPETKAPETKAPETKAPETKPPVAEPTETYSAVFYQKLKNGEPVKILVVGDSIAEGGNESPASGHWVGLLCEEITKTYGSKVTVMNVSMSGNTSYCGYVRVNELPKQSHYDLAIICYGQNDKEENFSTYYESILRAIGDRDPECTVISILQSSQRRDTKKIKAIRELCAYYQIPTADTIAAFKNSGVRYDALAPDGIHPNKDGKKLYFETLRQVIEEHLNDETSATTAAKAPFNERMDTFEKMANYSTSAFQRVDDVTYQLTFRPTYSVATHFAIDYMAICENTWIKLYVDGEEVGMIDDNYAGHIYQHRIVPIGRDVNLRKTVKLVFATKVLADDFEGVYLSYQGN